MLRPGLIEAQSCGSFNAIANDTGPGRGLTICCRRRQEAGVRRCEVRSMHALRCHCTAPSPECRHQETAGFPWRSSLQGGVVELLLSGGGVGARQLAPDNSIPTCQFIGGLQASGRDQRRSRRGCRERPRREIASGIREQKPGSAVRRACRVHRVLCLRCDAAEAGTRGRVVSYSSCCTFADQRSCSRIHSRGLPHPLLAPKVPYQMQLASR